MKKTILSLVATLAIAGCVKNEIAAPVYELGFEPEEVVATLDDDETKTSLGSTGSVLWSQDDHITVLYKGTKYAMSYKVKADGVGTNQATFSYDATQGFYTTTVETAFTKYYGFYPALAANTVPMEDGKLQVTIPATQSYAKESFDATAAVMTGSSTTTDIPFKNATGLLKIFLTPKVPGTPGFCKVQSITVSSASEKLLAGAAYIDANNAAVIKEGGVSAVTLSCGEDGAALDESESFRTYVGNAFIFALPPTVFGENDLKITINLLNADGTAREAVVKTVPQTFTVARTKIAVVPVSYDSLEDIHGGIETTSAADIAELNERLEAEATNIVLDGANDAHNTSVVFPEAAEEKDITITITGDIAAQTDGEYEGEKVIFFENAEVGGTPTDGPATLTVSAPAGTVLVFNTPQSHVTVNGTTYDLISGRFDVNTLVIPEGVTVKKLVMEYGSASILGTVEAVEIKGTEDVFFKECAGLSQTVYSVISDHVHSDYVAVQNGSVWNIVERPTAAKIGDKEYKTLAAAVEAATAGQTVTLAEDVEVTEKIILSKSITLDLNGHVITNKVNQARTFEFANSGIDFTIDGTKAGSGMTIPEGWDNRNGSQKSWGFIRTNYAGCNITLNGGTYTGKTQNGSFITTRYVGFTDANWDDESTWSNVTLNNVSMTTNLRALDLHYVNKVTVNGGEFVVTGGEDNAGTPVSVAFTIEEAQDGIFNGVSCNSPVANIEVISGKIKFLDCDFTAIAGWSGSVDATNIGVSYCGHAIVESGSYKITDPNNLKTKTGGSLFVYSSGGTIEANGGSFVGIDHVIKIGFDRGTFGYLYKEGEVPSNIIVKGGSFTGTFNKYYGSDADNNVTISGGTFNVDPSAYVATGYEATEEDGIWTVAEAQAPAGISTQEEFVTACAAAESGDVIVLGAGEFAIGPVDINGKTLTFKGQGADKTTIYIGNGGYDGNGGHGSSKTANMTFEDVTLDDLAADSGYLTGFTEAAGLTFRNVTFNVGFSNWGNKGGEVSFYNCTFNQKVDGKYNVQELRSANNTHYLFDGCTFNSAPGRFINAYKQGGASAFIEIIVKDCAFIGTAQSKAALNLKSDYSDGCNIDLYLLGTNTTTDVKNGSKTGNPLFDDNGTHATVYQGADKDSATIIWQGGAAK